MSCIPDRKKNDFFSIKCSRPDTSHTSCPLGGNVYHPASRIKNAKESRVKSQHKHNVI